MSAGSIDRDLGTSGRPLGGSGNDECIEDRGFGRFMDLQELPRHLQGASPEPLEASREPFGALLIAFCRPKDHQNLKI